MFLQGLKPFSLGVCCVVQQMCRLKSPTGGIQISLFLTAVLQDLAAEGLNNF